MMGAPDEAAFLSWLLLATGGKRVVEVGVFRGTTTLAIAKSLPSDGIVVGLDISDEFAQMGKRAWADMGVADKVDFRVGPAVDSLKQLIAEGRQGTFDLAFIDADKENYPSYYELCLQLLRPGGIIAVDNVLWGGAVIDPPEQQEEHTKAIVAVTAKIRNDPRVHAVMLPIADGVYLCRKL